jgi:hypothetical protein
MKNIFPGKFSGISVRCRRLFNLSHLTIGESMLYLYHLSEPEEISDGELT